MSEGTLREPYATLHQQRQAALLGMHVFLASEVMLFGGLFAVLLVVRVLHPHEVVEASRKLHVWIGATNTAVLLTSSLLVAIAVEAARATRARTSIWALAAAAALGLLFLGLKALEYTEEYREGLLPGFGDAVHLSGPVDRLFMNIYLVATALHAVHVTVGVVLLAAIALCLRRAWLPLLGRATVVENAGLYWHLVDVIWIFLYPVLYLAR